MTGEASTLFEVVSITPQGAVQTERLRAGSERQALEQIRLRGFRTLTCRPLERKRGGVRLRGVGRHRLDVGLFTDELAALLDAGLGIGDTLRTLAQKEAAGPARAALEAVSRDISEGSPLSSALANQSVFPQLLVASISASEQTGDLVSALRRYSAHRDAMRLLRGKLVGAAIYPALLLGVGTLVVFFLLGVVVPRFSVLIEDSGNQHLPYASTILLSFGKEVAAQPMAFATGFLAVVTAIAIALIRAARSGWQIAGLQEVWIVGSVVRLFRHAQFYRTAAMLVEGGVPALRAFEMGSRLLAEEDRSGLARARQEIAEGKPIGPALAREGLADAVALRMLEVAQRTGRLAEVLARIAAFQEAALGRAVDLAARLVEPALMIFIGLVIGGIVVLMYMPIFDLATSLQ